MVDGKSDAQRIGSYGFRQPVLVDKDKFIISGHGRVLAAQSLGMNVVPCIKVTDLSPEQVRAFRIADRRALS